MPATDLDLLLDAARAAADIALPAQHRDLEVTDKGDGQGPVTDADLAVDAMLRETLLAARPGYGWLSEETPDDTARLACEHVFVVDPIDGTRSYIAGSKDWAHSLAVVRNGAVTAAVVHLPARGLVYAATAGGGATLNGARIRVSTSGVTPTVLANKRSFASPRWRYPPDATRAFRSSLAWRLALVAEGRFDAMLTLDRAWEWDVAAGALLVAEAGGTVTDAGGAPPVFNAPAARTDGLVAAGPDAHAALMAAL